MFWTIRRILVLLGGLAAAAVIATLLWVTSAYQGFAVSSFSGASGELLNYLVQKRVVEEYPRTNKSLFSGWTRQREFLSAAEGLDKDAAVAGTKAVFASPPAVNKDILLRHITVYDKDMNILAQAPDGTGETLSKDPAFVEQMNAREKKAKRKVASFMWRTEGGQPVHSLIAPIGGIRALGFVEFVTDPTPALAGVSTPVKGDVQVLGPDGGILLEDVPEAAPNDDAVMSTFDVVITDEAGAPWADAKMSKDVSSFQNTSTELQAAAFTMSAIVLLAIAVIGFILIKFAVLNRLRSFAGAMQQLSDGETGVAFPATGKDEMGTMAQAMEALREAVRQAYRLRRIIEDSPIQIALTDTDGKVTFLNQTARTYLGLASDAALPDSMTADLFGKGEAFTRKICDTDALPFNDKVDHGDEILNLDVSSLISRHGNHVGSVMSWSVETEAETSKRMSSELMDDVSRISSIVAEQTTILETLSQDLAAQSEQTVQHTAQAVDITSGATQQSQTVAATTSDMANGIQEIASKTDAAQTTSSTAVQVARTGNKAVSQLSEASARISEVVGLITDIASQTHLLALNANIEAARAGDAGKGFAVVAAEVGNLAKQTTQATEQISSIITEVTGLVDTASDTMGSLDGVIRELSELQTDVSHAMNQQQRSTQEIETTIHTIAEGAEGVSGLITDVRSEAQKTGQISGQLLDLASRINGETAELNTKISDFRQQMAANG